MSTEIGKVYQRSDFVVEWKIQNVFGLKKTVGGYYSPTFSFASASWNLIICSNIENEAKTERHIGLYLRRESAGPPISLQYYLGLKIVHGNIDAMYSAYTFNEAESYGISDFMSTSELLKRRSQLAPGDVVTVVCTLMYPAHFKAAVTKISATTKCSYCTITLDADEDISTHLQKCAEFPIKCPKCGDVVPLKNCFDHKCQTTEAEGRLLKHKAKHGEFRLSRKQLYTTMPEGQVEWKRSESVFEWKIENFCENVSKMYCSPSFSFGNAKWYLSVKSVGSDDTLQHYFQALLHWVSGPSIKLEFSLGVKTVNEDVDKVQKFTYVFQEPEGCGTRKFLSGSELHEKKSILAPSDALTVVCTMKFPANLKDTGDGKVVKKECCYCKISLNAQEDISRHLQKCTEFPIKCQKCDDDVALKNWQDHKCHTMGAEGNGVITKCCYCEISLDAQEDISHHLQKCTEFPIKCPECDGAIALKNYHNHKCQAMDAKGNGKLVTTECSYCKISLNAQEDISCHLQKCTEFPIKCRNCYDDVALKNWQDHKCQTKGTEAKCSYCEISLDAQEDISHHLQECTEFPVKCPKCGNAVALKNYHDHICQKTEAEGKGVTAKCSYCEISLDSQEDISHHLQECTEFPVKCPKCGNAVALKNYHDHICQKTEAEDVVKIAEHHINTLDTESISSQKNCLDESLKSPDILDTLQNPDNHECQQPEVQDSSRNLSKDQGLTDDINNLLKEQKGLDVTFVIETSDGKMEFYAHKLILAVSSSYFADMFYSEERKKEKQIISLVNVNPNAIENVISYCYGCKPALKTTKDACALMKVALDFEVQSLVKVCYAYIVGNKIEPKDVFSLLEISEKMDNKSLRDMCIKMLEEKTREVIGSFKLCDVTQAMVHTILDLQNLSLDSEYELVEWLFSWAKLKCEDCSIHRCTRKHLEKLLSEINFLSLTGKEFAMLCKDNPEFFSSDEIASICLNRALPGTTKMPEWHKKNTKSREYIGS